jgi:hypothetical protein
MDENNEDDCHKGKNRDFATEAGGYDGHGVKNSSFRGKVYVF